VCSSDLRQAQAEIGLAVAGAEARHERRDDPAAQTERRRHLQHPAGHRARDLDALLRLLHRRDGTNPRTLLAMATTVGARVLGLDPSDYELSAGTRSAGLVAVDLSDGDTVDLSGLLLGSGRSRLLLGGK